MTRSNKAQERDGRRSTRMRGLADTSAGVYEVSCHQRLAVSSQISSASLSRTKLHDKKNFWKCLEDECLSNLGNREIKSPNEIKPPNPD
jgi:hypothetical protein